MKSSNTKRNFRPGSLRPVGSAHTLLLQMARDAEELQAQADRIRGLRKMARVSQAEAANRIGVSLRAYADWEAARSDIKPENIKKLAMYYGSSADYIEYGTMRQNGETPDPFAGQVTTDQLADMLSEVKEMLLLARDERAKARADQARRAAAILRRIDALEDAIQGPAQEQRHA